MRSDEFFYSHPIFRHEEFVAWKQGLGEIKPSSINTALRYYLKEGRLKLVRRKLYAVVPPNQSQETLQVDPYLIAGKATEDAVLAYHTALELFGIAYSIFGQFTYITEQKSKPFEYEGQWFQSVALPAALKKQGGQLIGVNTMDRQGVTLKITSAERTFVDVLDRIDLCGGWEEVCRSLSHLVVLNVDEVIRYCLLLNNACLNAKVGYFLSQREGAFAVSHQQLKPLWIAKPKSPQYASKRTQEPFQLVKEWNIFLPHSVLAQTWEEPDVNV